MARKNKRQKAETFVIPKDLLMQIQKHDKYQTNTNVYDKIKCKKSNI